MIITYNTVDVKGYRVYFHNILKAPFYAKNPENNALPFCYSAKALSNIPMSGQVYIFTQVYRKNFLPSGIKARNFILFINEDYFRLKIPQFFRRT